MSMILVAAIAYLLTQGDGGIAEAVPVLGALALGAQRMLPAMQSAYAAWVTIIGDVQSLSDVTELLDQPMPRELDQLRINSLDFNDSIVMDGVAFRYGRNGPWVLEGVDLQIKKGTRVGLIGVTGAGKSTLLDIVMGLLLPSKGLLKIDGQTISPENQRAWQACIAHVPQSIFLTDRSIEENIAFGVEPHLIDRKRVLMAAAQAQIHDTIESWVHGYKTVVGERGIRLSGGQRQRIGIARALYKRADVLILDEATSALDSDTESAVMEAIEALNRNLTVIIIAHRISTLRDCDQIVEIGSGSVKRIGNYRAFVDSARP
jgi:ATP-binding cassette subfamily B protein